MSRGFTLIELALTVIILSILSAFTFSVIWQYSKLYADTRGGYVYSEAAAVMERITRELKDAGNVDLASSDCLNTNPSTCMSFQSTHGTPSGGSTAPYWVQYCICSTSTSSGTMRALLYRVQFYNYALPPFTNQCSSQCPRVWSSVQYADLMSGNLMSRHNDTNTVANQGFQVRRFAGNGGVAGPQSDGYEITLALAADRNQRNLKDGVQSDTNPSISLVSRATPRNFCPYTTSCALQASNGLDRAFNGGYYDEIK